MGHATQVLVEYNGRTRCTNFDSPQVTTRDVLQRVSDVEGPPMDALKLCLGRTVLPLNRVLENHVIVKCQLVGGLRGGKGGFGAALKASGKGNKNRSINFGACRDLNGRRLRHVNNEIRLRKWKAEQAAMKQAKEKGITYVPSKEETPSGVEGWHLDLPAWAEISKKATKKYTRPQKTEMCRIWQTTRNQGVKPPPGAPNWWGCPRGRRCTYAHGESELVGVGLENLKEKRKNDARAKQVASMTSYSRFIESTEENMSSAVAMGLKSAKSSLDTAASKRDRKRARPSLPFDLSVPPPASTPQSSGAPGQVAPKSHDQTGEPAVDPSCAPPPECQLECISGRIRVGNNNEAQGNSKFGSIGTVGVALSAGEWYYEVELLTDGLMQIGWASDLFDPKEEEGDGVGDVPQSWSFDGSRGIMWNEGKEEPGGAKETWKVGDIIGTVVNLDEQTLRFSHNGKLLKTQKLNIPVIDHAPRICLYPVVSLEEGEAVRFNFGSRPFSAKPSVNALPVVHAIDVEGLVELDGAAATDQSGAANPAFPADSRPSPKKELPTQDKPPTKQSETTTTQANSTVKQSETTAPTPGKSPIEKTDTQATEKVQPKPMTPPSEPFKLDEMDSVEDVEAYGLDIVKKELMDRGLKCGGTLYERASRLFSVKGVAPGQYERYLLARPPKKRKNPTSS